MKLYQRTSVIFISRPPNQKWVADTTYIWTGEGWLFLAVVLDLFSRTVVAWSMATIQDATFFDREDYPGVMSSQKGAR
jgi:transposase InsO family protein